MSDAQPNLSVACLGFRGPVSRYFQRLTAMELTPAHAEITKRSLQRWRQQAPAQARFVPMMHPDLLAARFEGAQAQLALKRTLRQAALLRADTILFHTPASFRPSAENREQLLRFFSTYKGPRVAWWADGLWAGMPEERDALCAQAGLIPVVDPLALDDDEPLPAGEFVYWRLRGKLGMRAQFSDYDLDRLLQLSRGRRGYVTFTAPEMLRDAGSLLRLLAHEGGAPAGLEGFEGDDDLFDEEGEGFEGDDDLFDEDDDLFDEDDDLFDEDDTLS